MTEKLKKFRDSKAFSDLRAAGDHAVKIFNYILIIIVLLIAYQACNIEGELDGSLFTYDRATGHWELGTIHTEKKTKEVKKDTVMVGIAVDISGIRTYSVKRRLWTPLGMGVWGGLFIREGVHPRLGNQFGGGLSLDISF